jgi:hypothetical protein
MHSFKPVGQTVEAKEKIAPREKVLLVPPQPHARLVAAAYKQLLHTHLIGNLLKGLLGVRDR